MKNKKSAPAFLPLDWAFLFLGITAMSLSAMFLKAAETSPFTVGFYRMVFAVVGALPLLFFENKKRRQAQSEDPFFSKKRWPALKFALIAGILWGTSLTLWNTSVLHSNATTATLLQNLAPLWVGLITLLFFEEKPARRFWFGLAIALSGVAVMFWPTLSHFQVHWTTWAVLFGSFCYAFYLITQKKVRETGLSSIEMLFWVSLVAGIFIGIAGMVAGAPFAGLPAKTWLSLAAAGFISSLLGWGLIGHAMLRLPVTITGLALLTQAVFTAIFDFFVFGVQLSLHQIFGGLVVLFGLGLVVFKKSK